MTLRQYVDVCKGSNGPPVAFLVRALPIVRRLQVHPGEFKDVTLGAFESSNFLKLRILNP